MPKDISVCLIEQVEGFFQWIVGSWRPVTPYHSSSISYNIILINTVNKFQMKEYTLPHTLSLWHKVSSHQHWPLPYLLFLLIDNCQHSRLRGSLLLLLEFSSLLEYTFPKVRDWKGLIFLRKQVPRMMLTTSKVNYKYALTFEWSNDWWKNVSLCLFFISLISP